VSVVLACRSRDFDSRQVECFFGCWFASQGPSRQQLILDFGQVAEVLFSATAEATNER